MSLGPKLEDLEELLYRQVHPSWLQAGRPTSQAFRPTPKDSGFLSVSRGAVTNPEAAFLLHTEKKGLSSAGVWSVTVGDCAEAERDVYSDRVEEPVPDPAHAVVDFRGLAESKAKAISQQLRAKATCEFLDQR